MNPRELLDSIGARVQGTASVRQVFGEPVSVGDRTVIPVARVIYGFGAGAGATPTEEGARADGGGGGGGVAALPAGVVEVSPAGTRFIPFVPAGRLALAMGAGFLLGLAFGARIARR
jgi:uncharacterized spore protein YtfJ